MKPAVYVETTVISYLTARPSSDPVLNGDLLATRQWWNLARGEFDLYTSSLVVDEAAQGDHQAAEERRKTLATMAEVPITEAARSLAHALVVRNALPSKARVDALHVAIAAAHGMEYLLTWNCRHLANAVLRSRIEGVCRDHGFEPPVICTPPELMGATP
jgi:hypothetical protein